jgi:hypothetical protein
MPQVPCFVRDALVDVPGHNHRYHHLGMVQSLPPGVLAAAVARASRAGLASASMLLQNASNSAAAPGAAAGNSAGLVLPRSSVKAAVPGSMPYLNIGVPVVFHRTSFNSKFFPDCLDKKKIADKYCQVFTSRETQQQVQPQRHSSGTWHGRAVCCFQHSVAVVRFA